jgi:thymidylate synthase (FAD)
MQTTKRVVSEGAEDWLNKPIDILDHGFVYLVDYMGDDLSIEQAARTSYGPGTKQSSSSTGLIRYLMRHRHTSPIEMVDLKFHLKMPIFVARQWMRHRTASINEMSARYSVLPSEFYIPNTENINLQSSVNNQGRGDQINKNTACTIQNTFASDAENAYNHYERMMNSYGLAREIARGNLPVSIYTEFYWKVNLHNLLHFLNLRLDSHSQFEIREYANAIDQIVASGWPTAHQAFSDYVRNSMTFSSAEQNILKCLINNQAYQHTSEWSVMSSREQKEFLEKIKNLTD